MRVVIQRVAEAAVKVAGETVGQINRGCLIYLGIEDADDETDADWLVNKISQLRIFDDEKGVMNLSLLDVQGEVLIISQFTLHAKTKKGNRPSYIHAAKPEKAEKLYNYFIRQFSKNDKLKVQSGVFGAHMAVSSVNDGPVTILIDTKNRE